MSPASSRLLPLESFAAVIEPLRGKRIGYVRPVGNVGDLLIEWGMRQLFDEFQIHWRFCDPRRFVAEEFDELVFGGGGNMGERYPENWELRALSLATGLPVTILPQSFTSPEERPYRRVYVRERASLAYCRHGVLAPDLALAVRMPDFSAPRRGRGVFLRRDPERASGWRWFARDPVRLCDTPEEYLSLAASYEHIVTDRLHFAICGLVAGRRTTLLPNDYHKNRAMFETWLRPLGCEFAESVRKVVSARNWLPRNLQLRLALEM